MRQGRRGQCDGEVVVLRACTFEHPNQRDRSELYPEPNLLPALVDRERSCDGQDARQYSGETTGQPVAELIAFRVGQMRVRDETRGPYLRRLGLVGGNFGSLETRSFSAFLCISGALVARLKIKEAKWQSDRILSVKR